MEATAKLCRCRVSNGVRSCIRQLLHDGPCSVYAGAVQTSVPTVLIGLLSRGTWHRYLVGVEDPDTGSLLSSSSCSAPKQLLCNTCIFLPSRPCHPSRVFVPSFSSVSFLPSFNRSLLRSASSAFFIRSCEPSPALCSAALPTLALIPSRQFKTLAAAPSGLSSFATIKGGVRFTNFSWS